LTDARPPWIRLLRFAGRGLAYVVGLLAIMTVTLWALAIPPMPALQAIWFGAVGDGSAGAILPISVTITKMTPLLLTGLSVVVAWRAGMFSIGAEGQLLVGALTAMTLWSAARAVPPIVLVPAMLAAGTAAGAVWSGLAGWLRVHRNVPEVISTIMLNYIALDIIGALVTAPGPLHGATQSGPHSDPLPPAVSLPDMLSTLHSEFRPHLHLGVALALATVPCVWLYLFRTPSGFGVRVVGHNPDAARAARLPLDRLRMQAMLVSGALCGLAGAIELLGVTGRLGRDFSPGWGYTAIPVALLGGLSPGGALLSSVFFGALAAGCGNAQRTAGIPSFVAYVIQAATVLAIVAGRAWQNRRAGVEVD
jgi:simple sugar transport system permease protein